MASPFDYDPLTYMVVVIMVIFLLLGFIVIISYNILHSDRELVDFNLNIGCDTNPTAANCIPRPTPLPRI